ncbi:glycoside hydrolase family 28 protein [Sphingosinicella sp. BN140058]|uniref:glycoside hydrolase family 28 protein n=1 Tax=Sphingosinicella sp. BN140058 TaxID=1892855 RepID=UPI00101076C2|nr:glycoside hydrolase family 28 protein [Sphingosinicella sp. BN140058]QAY76010.1 glycoside hydrolase family 28 protein [Sphingosinicella sp. BN140058]
MIATPSRREILHYAGAGTAAAMLPAGAFAAATDPWRRARDIAARVRPPTFRSRTFDIVRHGARGDGRTLCTAAIASAIDACAKAGGGRVLVPAGRFLTGAVHLRSNVELHLADDATLAFSTDPADYPMVFTRWEGIELINYSPFVYAHGQSNIALTGRGTLDGQADAQNWWSWKGKWGGTIDHGWREGMPDQRKARAILFQMAENGVPVEKRRFGDGHYLRPAFVQPYACENVLIEGVRLINSPFWNIHPVLCRNIVLRGVRVEGHGPNNDGCDPESVDHMLIEGCTFDTGDDCIAVNSGRNADGRRLATPSQNILIRNCHMKEGHGGVVVGSQISGAARWVFAEKCRMDSPDLWYAIRFKNNALRGGLLENFHYRDLDVGEVGRAAIACDFNYEEGADGPFKPQLRNIVVERLRARKAVRVIDSQGLPGAPVEGITLRDCAFDGVTEKSIVRHTSGLRLERVRINGRAVDRLETV